MKFSDQWRLQMFSMTNIISKLSTYQPALLPDTPIRAAVMIILLRDANDNVEIVITKRAAGLPTYAGHYSFPGGMWDLTDKDLYVTAQREIQEELNLASNSYQPIGQLNDFIDRFGNLVRPFVVTMRRDEFHCQQQISQEEIEKLYFLPISKLSEFKDDPSLHKITKRRPSFAFRDGDAFIWGLTASILVHFYQILQLKIE